MGQRDIGGAQQIKLDLGKIAALQAWLPVIENMEVGAQNGA
jgi:hypothetical protein